MIIRIIKGNIYLYLAFICLMAVSMLSEYILGAGVTKYTKQLSFALFLFPIISLVMNFILLKHFSVTKKALLSIGFGVVFFLVGYEVILLFASFRINLGLTI